MDKNELGEIYKKTVNKVYRYVYSRVGHRELTEDIVTDTYMTFVSIADRYSGKSTMDTFIIGIARNKILQAISKEAQIKYIDLDIETIVTDEEDDIELIEEREKEYAELATKLKSIWSKLPANYMNVLKDKFVEGLSNEEIAKRLDISRDNLRVLLHRAIKKATQLANSD